MGAGSAAGYLWAAPVACRMTAHDRRRSPPQEASMPASETAEAVSRTVTDLGRRVGLSAQEFNVGLWLAGLLGGEPGAWWFTEEGKRFATSHYHQNGYGGSAHRSWDVTTWLETVTDELDLSEAGIARI